MKKLSIAAASCMLLVSAVHAETTTENSTGNLWDKLKSSFGNSEVVAKQEDAAAGGAGSVTAAKEGAKGDVGMSSEAAIGLVVLGIAAAAGGGGGGGGGTTTTTTTGSN